MATYKASDLINLISELINDGFEYIDITEISSSVDSPTSLSFSGISDSHSEVDYDSIDSVDIPSDYDVSTESINFSSDDTCPFISFTFNEILTISHSNDNALEYYKDCLKSPDYDREIKSEIKQSSVEAQIFRQS